MMSREEVYAAIDSEREYQIRKWGADEEASVAAFITFLDYYLDSAKHAATKINPIVALDDMRKIAALAVACMEKYGAPKRETASG